MKQCQTLRHTPNRRGLRHSACSFPTVQTAPVLQANPKNSMRSNKVLHDPARFDVAKPMWLFGYLPCWLMPVKHQRKRSAFRNSLAGPLGFAAVFYHSFSIVLCKPFWFWLTSVQGNCLSPCGHFLARQREPVHPSPAGCHGEWTETTPDIRSMRTNGCNLFNSQCLETSLGYPAPSRRHQFPRDSLLFLLSDFAVLPSHWRGQWHQNVTV